MRSLTIVGIFLLAILVSCSTGDDSDGGGDQSGFDRKALLENIADNIAIPAYENLTSSLSSLQTTTSEFTNTRTVDNLVTLREAWSEAYIAWQSVSVFEIGKAEEISFRNFMNVYPVTPTAIDDNITNGSYDLTLVSKQDEQGFGALDYLLNGIGVDDKEIVAIYENEVTGVNYRKYLTDLTSRMVELTNIVLSDWKSGYRDTFVNNNGSSATTSFDKLVNDYIFHYEKHLRAGKIGIPAGAFTGNPLEDRVEAYYDGDLSKQLFVANLNALQDMFNGRHFSSSATGESFKGYLDYLNEIKEGEDLSALINDRFNTARSVAEGLEDNFSSQVRMDNSLMLQTFDRLQENVILLKVDMLSAFSVVVDFVDADGD